MESVISDFHIDEQLHIYKQPGLEEGTYDYEGKGRSRTRIWNHDTDHPTITNTDLFYMPRAIKDELHSPIITNAIRPLLL